MNPEHNTTLAETLPTQASAQESAAVRQVGGDPCGAARAAAVKGDLEDAVVILQEHVTNAPSDGRAWNDLGVMEHAQGRPQEAEQCFARAVSCNPQDAIALQNLVDLYVQTQRYEMAVLLARQWTDSLPQDANAWAALAALQLTAGDVEAGRASLDIAGRLAPDNGAVARARALLDQGNEPSEE